MTHPAYAMHVHGAGWAIENHGVEPDVAVASRAFGDIVTGLVARTLRG